MKYENESSVDKEKKEKEKQMMEDRLKDIRVITKEIQLMDLKKIVEPFPVYLDNIFFM